MRHRVFIVCGVAILGLAGAPAAAQGVDDVRCLIASNFFIKAAKDEKARRVAESAGFFYLGRLDRFSPAQLRIAVTQQRKALTGVNLTATMNNCANRMISSVRSFERAVK